MGYAGYLREKSRECIALAVAEPWSQDAGRLIDLAMDYSGWASGIEEPQSRRSNDRTGAKPRLPEMAGALATG